MDPELSSLFEQQEQRLSLMRELNAALECAQGAFVVSDLNKMELYTARQQTICEALCAIGTPEQSDVSFTNAPWFGKTESGSEDKVSAETKERWNLLARELEEVAERVRHLNRVHAALLRRGRQTVEIFLRVMANTYAPPQNQPVAVGESSRK